MQGEGGAPAARAAVMVMVAFGLMTWLLASSLGGPGYFLQLGERSEALPLVREHLGPDIPVWSPIGHDGERFWSLARDPLLLEGQPLADQLDRPAYRAQRIAYPLLAAPWRAGGETALLWGLVITNVLVIGAGTYLTGGLAQARGTRSRFVPYAFALNPLVWLSFLFDLSDALALAGLVAAMWAIHRRRSDLVAVSSVVACLAKETSLLGLLVAAGAARGLPWRQRLALVLPGALAAAGWRAYVLTRPGFHEGGSVREFRLVAFSGYLDVWGHGFPDATDWVYLAVTLSILAFSGYVVALWWRDRRDLLLCASVPYALLTPFLAPVVIDVPINSVRVIGPAVTLVAVYLASRRVSPSRREGLATVGESQQP
ncbi:hypothetical protein [Rhabdothermincola sediminis]|uniref:hypothetical protein n=1 Tax=Rhabdothermincola sediminis TaxID=2751370 RepID=UPI001AA06AF0|nr:hypothetical protein [Rhabdothermincola sediminis]